MLPLLSYDVFQTLRARPKITPAFGHRCIDVARIAQSVTYEEYAPSFAFWQHYASATSVLELIFARTLTEFGLTGEKTSSGIGPLFSSGLSEVNLSRQGRELRAFMSYVDPVSLIDLEAIALKYLHPGEKEYFGNLRHERRKSSYLSGRIAAKMAIGAFLDEENPQSIFVDRGCFEQPVVFHDKFYVPRISISHHRELALAFCCEAGHVCGIDLEGIEANREKVYRRQLTKDEIAWATNEKNGIVSLTMLWTIKEALSKVLRCGLLIDHTLLETCERVRQSDEKLSCRFVRFTQYRAISWLIGNRCVSIVLPRKTEMNFDFPGWLRKELPIQFSSRQ